MGHIIMLCRWGKNFREITKLVGFKCFVSKWRQRMDDILQLSPTEVVWVEPPWSYLPFRPQNLGKQWVFSGSFFFAVVGQILKYPPMIKGVMAVNRCIQNFSHVTSDLG